MIEARSELTSLIVCFPAFSRAFERQSRCIFVIVSSTAACVITVDCWVLGGRGRLVIVFDDSFDNHSVIRVLDFALALPAVASIATSV